jgi:hypothetical protein
MCAGVSASVVALALWPASRDVRTEDRDGDGRPDVWRMYDRHGQLVELAIDSNFDGRSDVREYYTRGALVRRESDRWFSGRVDLVEEFDGVTHEHVRSVADTDHDGTADLLVLFRAGKPVFTKRLPVAALPGAALVGVGYRYPGGVVLSRAGEDAPAPLTDPFSGEAAVRSALVTGSQETSGSLWTSVGLPARYCLAISSSRPASDVADLDTQSVLGGALGPPSPRGPPLA